MSSRVLDNTPLIKHLVQSRATLTNRLLIEEIHSRSIHKTPMDKGALRTMVSKSVAGNVAEIQWRAPYAIFQENKQFQNYTTPGTGPHFAESSVSEAMDKLQEIWEETE